MIEVDFCIMHVFHHQYFKNHSILISSCYYLSVNTYTLKVYLLTYFPSTLFIHKFIAIVKSIRLHELIMFSPKNIYENYAKQDQLLMHTYVCISGTLYWRVSQSSYMIQGPILMSTEKRYKPVSDWRLHMCKNNISLMIKEAG